MGVGSPLGFRGAYPNFPGPVLAHWACAYHEMSLDRLVRIKARYDHENVFSFR